MKIKIIGITVLLTGFFFLSSCSPKTSQPCPKVYNIQKDLPQNLCYKTHYQRFNVK